MRAAPASLLCLAAFLAACVPVDEINTGDSRPDTLSASRPDGQPFETLDAGAADLDSLHFKVRAYGQDAARQVSQSAEGSYNRIMVDTNLFSFQPRALYQIVVYGSQDEYRRKTGQPEWSGGCSVGSAIYTFVSPQTAPTIAHEMTHVIWYEYMGRLNLDHRWINEGLAVYEELKAAGLQRADPFAYQRGTLRSTPLSVDQLVHLVPATEREKTVALWYAESQDIVRFLIERGGRMGFSQFLAGLRDGRAFDDAVGSSFAGQWRTLDDAYQAWQRSLQ